MVPSYATPKLNCDKALIANSDDGYELHRWKFALNIEGFPFGSEAICTND